LTSKTQPIYAKIFLWNIDCYLQEKRIRKACSLPLPILTPIVRQQLQAIVVAYSGACPATSQPLGGH